jgi:hypothetical protein
MGSHNNDTATPPVGCAAAPLVGERAMSGTHCHFVILGVPTHVDSGLVSHGLAGWQAWMAGWFSTQSHRMRQMDV